jgi:hypothetical protein
MRAYIMIVALPVFAMFALVYTARTHDRTHAGFNCTVDCSGHGAAPSISNTVAKTACVFINSSLPRATVASTLTSQGMLCLYYRVMHTYHVHQARCATIDLRKRARVEASYASVTR